MIKWATRLIRPITRGFCEDKTMDPTKYYENRIASLKNTDKYPYQYQVSTTIKDFLKNYSKLAKQEQKVESVAGRITSIRKHGKLTFMDLRQEHLKLQIVTDRMDPNVRRGDIINVEGLPFRTQKGELSLKASNMKLLSPCLRMLPEYGKLKEQQTRYRKRYLDMLINAETVEKLKVRSKIIRFLRDYLNRKDFLQVETPSLSVAAGGAIAKPFETYLHELDMKLFMRIAPQLYLKQLMIGGLQKVYQIGKNFRNEGMDQTHNPQFTSCELYQAYANYHDMVRFTEELLGELVKDITGSYELKTVVGDQTKIVNFKGPYRQIPLVAGLGEKMKIRLPQEYDSEESRQFLDQLCVKQNVVCGEPRTASRYCLSQRRLLDKLAGKYLEQEASPLFIIDHPRVMSPLAKAHPGNPHLTQRFELFVNGWQIVNSYTQLNDPVQQLKNSPRDEEYAHSLEYGLMPCAGWGIGIDRLVMLLTGSNNIQEVIAFPLMKPRD